MLQQAKCAQPPTHIHICRYAYMLFGIVRDPWLPGTANSRATALWENVVPDTPGQLDQALRICQPEMHQSMIPWPLDPLGVCFLPQWAIQQMWGGRVADPHADVSVDTEAHLVPRVEDIVCSGFHDSLCDRLLQICGLFRWGGRSPWCYGLLGKVCVQRCCVRKDVF